MKRTVNSILAASFFATQFLAISAHADSFLEKMTRKVEEKIHSSKIAVGAGLNLKLDAGDIFQVRTGLDYNYVLDPDMGQYLRQDKWKDYVSARIGYGLTAERSIERYFSYGRFYSDWNTALKTFTFSPLDLKDLDATKLQQRMQSGDMASVTFDKATFLGLRVANSGTVSASVSVGRVITGKITVKMLKRADGKVTVTFANADETAVRLSANARVEIIPGLLKLKFLSYDHDARIRGQADLAAYTYDLNNEKAKEALNKVLEALDEPSILGDEDLLKQGIALDPSLSRGLIDVTSSDLASEDITSGVVKEQKLTSNIVAGDRSRFKFSLIPGLLESSNDKAQSINLVDIKMSGTFIKPGQYIVGYRTNLDREAAFGQNSRVYNVSSMVYQPDPIIQDPSRARGYRGLNDLIGLSYHTEAREQSNAKEMITYVKMCNAGLIDCAGPIRLSVVSPDSAQASNGRVRSSLNTNYFFSRGLFEQIKARLNWAQSSREDRIAAISQRLANPIREMVLDQPEVRTASLARFFNEILENDCYSNLIGLDAQAQQGNLFKRLFHPEKCGTNLYSISDEVVRLNMPSLLISLFNPNILPAAGDTSKRATAEDKADLAKYFTVSFNTQYITTDDVKKVVNGASYGMPIDDRNGSSAQVLEFTSLVNNWQQQQNLDMDQYDRSKMLKEKK